MAQAPYPPLSEPLADNLATIEKSTAKDLAHAPSLLTFIASQKQGNLGVLQEAVNHPAAALLQTYEDEGIPVHTGPPWLSHALDKSISKIPHVSACSKI